MPELSINERTKIVEFWHQSKSVKQMQRLFFGHFGVHMRYWSGGIENSGNASTEVIPRSFLKVTMWVAFECF